MNFISVTVFAFLIANSIAEDWKPRSRDEIANVIHDCLKSTKAKPDDVPYLYKDIIPETLEQSCLVACFYQKIDVAYKNGTVNVDFAVKAYETFNDPPFYKKEDYPNIKKTLIACNEAQPSKLEECEATKVYFKCYLETAPKNKVPLNM